MFKEKKKKYNYNSLFLIFMCLLFCFSFFPKNITIASADSVIYSNVLDDLKKDENFDINNYPANYTDYSLNVIQVAEGSSGELFVYVYQPCSPNDDLIATTINISKSSDLEPEEFSYVNYSLKLLNQENCLCKYIVEDFDLLDSNERYYDISSIYRKWNEKYDDSSGTDNTITEVAFAVAKKFIVITNSEGLVEYSSKTIDVVYVTDKWCGFVRYYGGFQFLESNDCDSWFVAFNTDKKIDKLLEADVYYVEQTWQYGQMALGVGIYKPFSNLIPTLTDENINDYSKIASLTSDDEVNFKGPGWWSKSYSWSRIQSTSDFIKSVESNEVYELGLINVTSETKITEEGYANLENKQWVLRFAETLYKREQYVTTQSIISNVTILRLKFISDGVTYNLGVIDSKQSSDLIPDNETTIDVELGLASWLKNIVLILFIIFLFVVFWPFIPSLLFFFVKIGKLILDVLWFIVKTIFKPIVWLFKKKE